MDILEFLSKVLEEDCDLFRGQLDKDWPMLPSIARIKAPKHSGELAFKDWEEVEGYLLEEFIKQAMPYMEFKPDNELDILVHAQHHGLPTKLLDWTTNPIKAMFFAVENP